MKLSNIYLIKWYGPFSTKEEIKEWEDIHLPIRFNLGNYIGFDTEYNK